MAQAAQQPSFSVDLSGHAALVTGAGAGIGRAVALALARSGAAVLVNDINPDHPDDVVDEIVAFGGRARAFHGDISNRFQASAAIETARDAFGRVNILVNAAGVYRGGGIAKLDEWDWRRLLDVNLTGAFFCTQLMGRVMADEGGGAIVNIASAWGDPLPMADGVAYVASKSGLIGMTRQAAHELASANVRVNAVCPANIADDDTPAQRGARVGTAEQVAAVVLFLVSEAAAFVNGQALHVDGGMTAASG